MILLSQTDLNRIKQIRGLAKSIDDNYLSISTFFLVDMNDNPINPILFSSPLKAIEFIPDSTPPSLFKFYVNLNESLIDLYFTETMNSASLNIDQLTLHSSINNTTSISHRLSSLHSNLNGSYSNSINGTILRISLGTTDLNIIKTLLGFYTSINNSYLSLTNISIQDVAGNYILPISTDNPIQVSACNTTSLIFYI